MTLESFWRWTRRVLIALLAVAALVVGGIAAAYALDTRGEPTTIRGLVVDGQPAGDLTSAELETLIDALREGVEQRPVTIAMPDGPRHLTAVEMGISFDADELAAQAMAAGKGGTTLDRVRAWLGSFTNNRSLQHELTFDRSRAESVVAGFDGLVVEEPTEPRLVMGREQALVVRSGVDGRRVDQAAIVDRLEQLVAAEAPFEVEAATIPLPPRIADEDIQAVADELNSLTAGGVTVRLGEVERTITDSALRVRLDIDGEEGVPEPAFDLDSLQRLIVHTFGDVVQGGSDPVFDVVDEEPVVVEEGEVALECCREDAAEVVANAILAGRDGTVTVDPKPSEDPRMVDWAAGKGVVEKVAEFTTEHNCCESRVSNIQRFADLVRGVYLMPGESLSLNEHVGERTREKGFVPAGTILSGHLVPTVGGGVSQFATTMFNAAFFAGFDFENYQSHSIYFSRYPYGREATISWPLPDLEFTNTTEYPALIWTSYTDTSITVSIYSTKHVEVEQSGQEVSSARQCTRVDTFRLRTYDDGRQVEDSVFATYRPAEGLDCNGNPTDRPDL